MLKHKAVLRPALVVGVYLIGCLACSGAFAASKGTNGDKMTSPTEPLLIIRYHRYDGDYTDAGLWTWDARHEAEIQEPEVMSSGRDDYGVYFVLRPSDYVAKPGQQPEIGFVPRLRRDWNAKDGLDRFWTPAMGYEIWLIGNDPNIYRSRPDISPKVAGAYIDSRRQILVKLSHPLDLSFIMAQRFWVRDSEGRTVGVLEAKAHKPSGGRSTLMTLQLASDLDVKQARYEVAAAGYRPAQATLRRVLDDPTLFVPTEPMGAYFSPEATTFRLFSPTATSASVVLYRSYDDSEPLRVLPMKNMGDGSWMARAEGNLEGTHYRLRVTTDRYGEREIIDPLATNTVGDGVPSRITDVRRQDPPGFRPVKRPDYGTSPTDAIIYQISVRDFTISPTSGVDEPLRGKFLGAIKPGTHLPGEPAVVTGLDHLKELGVTHVQIQPIQDFDNDEDNPSYNWGYMTAFFNSPEGWYATDIRGPARIREFKQFVQALHAAGIGVIMDVVYNHTGTQNTFEFAAPGYYLRTRDDGSFYNGSGTGNEMRSEAPMVRRFIVDSCKYWVEEFGVDGFRFDLMGLIDLDTMLEIRRELLEIDPRLLIYGEPWAATGPDGTGVPKITDKRVVRGTGLGAFNDHFRNALKGEPDGNSPGYVQNGSRRDGVIKGIAGSIDDWTADPAQSINYATVHDNLDLWDKLLVSAPKASEEEHRKMVMLTGAILSVSQGVMFLHSGTDFCRYKQGNHNSYNAGDEVNQIDWSRKKTYAAVNEYFRGLIGLRRAHPMFRLRTAQDVRQRLKFIEAGLPAAEAIVFTLDGSGLPGETWKRAAVLINPTSRALKFRLPIEGECSVFVQGAKASKTPIGRVSGEVEVEPRTLLLVAQE